MVICTASLFRQACQQCTDKQSNVTKTISFRVGYCNVISEMYIREIVQPTIQLDIHATMCIYTNNKFHSFSLFLIWNKHNNLPPSLKSEVSVRVYVYTPSQKIKETQNKNLNAQ